MKPTARRSGAPAGSRKVGRLSETLTRLRGWTSKAYEWILELPVPVVLALLWLMGVVLLGVGVLALYLYVSALARMLLGP